jgi:hypothetical protein
MNPIAEALDRIDDASSFSESGGWRRRTPKRALCARKTVD